jgi:hypothetical protein
MFGSLKVKKMFDIDKILGYKKKNNNINTKKMFNNLKPIKETKISGKPVQIFNNNPIPKRSTIKNAYDKIPDDTNIPLQFMTRKQYLKKYVNNQERKNGVKFSKQQRQKYYKNNKDEYGNIIGRYTTEKNPYYKPAVVVFNDKSNFKNIKGDGFKKFAWHEFGHEFVEDHGVKMPKMREEQFANHIEKYGTNGKEFDAGRAKKRLNKMSVGITDDTSSKNSEDVNELFQRMQSVLDNPDKELDSMRQSDAVKSKDTEQYYKSLKNRDFEGLSDEARQNLQEIMQTENKPISRYHKKSTVKGQLSEGEYEYRQQLPQQIFGKDYIDLNNNEKNRIRDMRIERDASYKQIPGNDEHSENKIFYHGTNKQNIESIKEKGLKPNFSTTSDYSKTGKVYLSPSEKYAALYAQENFSNPTVLKIDVDSDIDESREYDGDIDSDKVLSYRDVSRNFMDVYNESEQKNWVPLKDTDSKNDTKERQQMKGRHWTTSGKLHPWQKNLVGLARQSKDSNEFLYYKDYGRPVHLTREDKEDFKLSQEKGSRDMSSMGSNHEQKGSIMFTNDLGYWDSHYNNYDYNWETGKEEYEHSKEEDLTRPTVAVIDLSGSEKDKAFVNANRGFGDEHFVEDVNKIGVQEVNDIEVERNKQKEFEEKFDFQNVQEIKQFYELANSEEGKRLLENDEYSKNKIFYHGTSKENRPLPGGNSQMSDNEYISLEVVSEDIIEEPR